MPRRFPDVARALAELLGTQFTAPTRAGTYTPDDFTGLLPYVRVTRTGGGSGHVDDKAEADVDVFAVDASDALALAEDIRQYLTDAPRRSGARIFDRITCEVGPAEVAPWAPQIKRVNAAYRVVSRRYTAS
jgi:GGDEF domain-containing protein